MTGVRRGAALPMMIFVLAMTGALAVSGAFVSRQLAGNVRAMERGAALEPLAEAALVTAVSAWDSVSRGVQPIGESQLLSATAAGDMRVDLWVTRLSARTFWLVANTRSLTRPPFARRLGVVVEVTNATPTLVSERAWGELP